MAVSLQLTGTMMQSTALSIADDPRTDSPGGEPPVPVRLVDTGLSRESVVGLVLKTLHVQGAMDGQALTDAICLPFPLLDEMLLDLQQRRLVEVQGAQGHGRIGYRFSLTNAGDERARVALEACMYVGPAPVPLDQYAGWVERQSIRRVAITEAGVRDAFRHLVLDPELFETLGPAVQSGKAIFLHGDAGNGKTMIAEAVADLFGGSIFLPHALDVNGQIVAVYDPVHHRRIAPAAAESGLSGVWRAVAGEHDRRWVPVKRPVVMAGGELTLEQLNLQYDPHTKMYQAPFQVKANGGVLIIDDFGRQRVPARDLLNRWIVPLEKRIDFLTLHTGGTFPIPFDSLLLFATNLRPETLVEEAFLRRIPYKLNVPDPTRPQYEEILARVCAAAGVPYDESAVGRLFEGIYEGRGIAPRCCHPRDLVEQVLAVAAYRGVKPEMTPELLGFACRTYFLLAEDGTRERQHV